MRRCTQQCIARRRLCWTIWTAALGLRPGLSLAQQPRRMLSAWAKYQVRQVQRPPEPRQRAVMPRLVWLTPRASVRLDLRVLPVRLSSRPSWRPLGRQSRRLQQHRPTEVQRQARVARKRRVKRRQQQRQQLETLMWELEGGVLSRPLCGSSSCWNVFRCRSPLVGGCSPTLLLFMRASLIVTPEDLLGVTLSRLNRGIGAPLSSEPLSPVPNARA